MTQFCKKHLAEIILSGLILLLMYGAMQISAVSGIADRFDLSVFRFSAQYPSQDIVIVALDDATINHPEFKRYQDIARSDYTKVLEHIFAGNPRAIGVDVFFFNPSEQAEDDKKLSQFLTEHQNIVVVNEFDFEQEQFLEPAESLNIPVHQKGYANLVSSSFHEKALINQIPFIFDPANVLSAQYEPFVLKIWRALYPGIQVAGFNEQYQIYTAKAGETALQLPFQDHAVNIYFFGKETEFPKISFFDVWKQQVDPSIFQNKIVLIGATAHDIHDEFFTPVSTLQFMSGVEIHAHALQTLLERKFLQYQSPLQALGITAGILFVLLIICGLGSFLWGTIATFVLLVACYGVSIVVFQQYHMVVSFFWPIMAGVFFWAGVYILRFLRAEEQKKQIRDTFSKYVAKDVVAQILANPEQVNLGGEAREITVFFSDLEGFTNISEQLKTHEVMQLINEYLDAMTKVILEEKGTVDKYMGDAIMAFWGAPLPCADHAKRACQAALQQQKVLPEINAKLTARGLPKVAVRIGINSGVAHVGNIGTHERLEYTAIGDHVNLGSRLEAINKQYGTSILISEYTRDLIGNDFFVQELDVIQVKGKEVPVRIFALLANKGAQTTEQEEKKEQYEKALLLYRAQKWEEALYMFGQIKDHVPTQTMLRRIEVLKNQKIPFDWDGVYRFVTK